MTIRNVSVSGWLVVAAATGIAGCSQERTMTPAPATDHAGIEHSAAPGAARGQDILQVKVDQAHNRRWVLAIDDVRVYDAATKALIRQVALPNWSVAKSVCMPDLALDRSGAAYVVSNVQARVWRIDGGTFQVSEHEIALLGKERWDIGFGAVTFAANGDLLALTANGNSAWKIDLASGRASAIEFYNPARKPCARSAEALSRIGRSSAGPARAGRAGPG